jgi:hypothetical protein
MHFSLLFAVLLAPCANGIDVHVKDSLVDVNAKVAPVSAVIECLGQKLDIEVVDQDKVLPTRVISVAMRRQAPREAVEQILVQAGMNYALQLEKKTGGALKRIVITGTKPIPPGAPVMPASDVPPAASAEAPAEPPAAATASPSPAPSGAGGPGSFRERRRERQERRGGGGRPLPPGPDAGPGAAPPSPPPYQEPRSLTPTS